jgi:uncharacterized protein (TIGR03790 family)
VLLVAFAVEVGPLPACRIRRFLLNVSLRQRAVARLSVLCACLLGAVGPVWAEGAASAPEGEPAKLLLPPVGLRARDIAVVINDADSASVEVGRYYARQRGIPPDRVIHVRFAAGQAVMGFGDYERVRAVLDANVGPQVQAYALAWTLPYRVECMSVTAAFALGFDPGAYCAEGCQTTKPSPYFNSRSSAPFTDYQLRPAMLLAGDSVEGAKRLIDRGLRSDESWPEGTAYLVNTTDRGRSVRAESYERVRAALGPAYPIELIEANALEGKSDVMFEFIGIAQLAAMATNRYLDGAIADNLTSFGGALVGYDQTTALHFLTAGATGSYGTSSEPCNFRQKFPEVGVAMAHYLSGETLVEAYWKSVLMPGQGVFVGDPLARPFGGARIVHTASATLVQTRALPPGNYVVEAAQSSIGPFRPIASLRANGFGVREIRLPVGETRFLRLRVLAEAAGR